jgi:ABC-type transport system involved in multi-copper enzyme maturation permease subunit
MPSHFLAAWRSGLRSQSFRVLFILSLLGMGLVLLSSTFSGRQPQTVALDVGLSLVRTLCAAMSIFWCQELIGKEIDRKTVLFSLAYPCPRYRYILGRYFAILAMTLVCLTSLLALLVVTIKAGSPADYHQAHPIHLEHMALVGIYILMDLAVIAAFAVSIACVSTSSLMPLAMGIAFTIAARGLGPAVQLLQEKSAIDADMADQLGPVVKVIQFIVPDLSRLDLRDAVLYGDVLATPQLLWPMMQSVTYAVLLLVIGIAYFQKREFE